MDNVPRPRASARSKRTFRCLAALYLIYLGIKMLRDFEQVPESQQIGVGLAIGAFIIIGLWFLFDSYRDWRREKKGEAPETEQDAAAPEEVLPEPEPQMSQEEYKARVEELTAQGRVEELEELLKNAPEE